MTTVVPLDRLSRKQRRDLNEDDGTVAEQLVAEEFRATHTGDEYEWFDVRADSGTKYEVKSTWKRIGEDYPADGRFRLWQSQTRSLLSSDANGTAWYTFVLFDEDAGVARIQRRRPSTVSKLVAEHGGWNESGHSNPDLTYQKKLPWTAVFDR